MKKEGSENKQIFFIIVPFQKKKKSIKKKGNGSPLLSQKGRRYSGMRFRVLRFFKGCHHIFDPPSRLAEATNEGVVIFPVDIVFRAMMGRSVVKRR